MGGSYLCVTMKRGADVGTEATPPAVSADASTVHGPGSGGTTQLALQKCSLLRAEAPDELANATEFEHGRREESGGVKAARAARPGDGDEGAGPSGGTPWPREAGCDVTVRRAWIAPIPSTAAESEKATARREFDAERSQQAHRALDVVRRLEQVLGEIATQKRGELDTVLKRSEALSRAGSVRRIRPEARRVLSAKNARGHLQT